MIALFDTLCLMVISISALLHLNSMHRRAWWDRMSFALVAGGAFGLAMEWWWGHLTLDQVARLAFHAGCAMAGLALMAGRLQALFSVEHPTFSAAVVELLAIAETPEQFRMAQRAAREAVKAKGIERRQGSEIPDGFIERRFQRGN